jgi:hypothetical protein
VQLDENDELIWDDGNPFPEPCIDDVAPMVGKVNLLLPWEDTPRKNIRALQMVFLLKKINYKKILVCIISVSSRYTFVYQIWSFSICCGAAVSGKQKM